MNSGQDGRGARWLDALVADCRFAAAHFARRPVVTLTMLLVLAVGMSISTLLFSWVHAYAVQPPAGIERQEDLVRIRGSQTAGANGRVSRAFREEEFLEYRKLNQQFSGVAGWTETGATVAVASDAGRGLDGRVSFVTPNYFPVLGVRPLLGAGLPVHEIASVRTGVVAVIGHTAWEQLFARRPDVIGSTINVNGVAVTVVGVAPQQFVGARSSSSALQVWMPLSTRYVITQDSGSTFRAFARLREGVTYRAATASVQVVAQRFAEPNPPRPEVEPSADVVQLLATNGDPMFERDVRLMSLATALLGLLVLLITCTNVSALLTGLATARRQEIAIRLSLGAGRARLLRQLMTESVWLATVAAALALAVVWVVLRVATHYISDIPFELGISWPITAFTFGVALAVGLLFGLSPALHATRLGLASVMRDSSASIVANRARLQRGLVAAQIAFTQPLVVLLTATLLFVVREMQPRRSEASDRIISVMPTLVMAPGTTKSLDDALLQMRLALRRVQDRLESTPGVDAVLPFWNQKTTLGPFIVHPEDRVPNTPEHAIEFAGYAAGAGYFDAIGIPLIRGREITTADPSPEVSPLAPAIIGADLARRLWGAADPLGRRFQTPANSATQPRTLVVVGVINDPLAKNRDPREPDRVFVAADTAGAFPSLMLRTRAPATVLIPTVRNVIDELAPDVNASVRTLADIQDEHERRFRLVTSSVSAAGLVALLLSAIGLYAVIAFAVAQRTGEIAVRMAVGARGWQVVRGFVADGLRLSAFGLLFGLPASLLGLRLLMSVPDMPYIALPRVTAIAALGVILVATAAVWIPARRAAAVDPAVTLRRE